MAARQWFRAHAFRSKKTGLIVLCGDNAAYYNWGEDPNTLSVEEEGEDEAVVRAVRFIEVGEELTDDYDAFADWSPW